MSTSLRGEAAALAHLNERRTPLFIRTAGLNLKRTQRSACWSLRWVCSCASKTSTAISWNVNSLRALIRKNPNTLENLIENYNASVLCLQETKLRKELEDDFDGIVPKNWAKIFHSSTARLGYSGTAIFSENSFNFVYRCTGHKLGDDEGRATTIELDNCVVMSVYSMNSGENLKRLPQRMEWDSALRRHIRHLRTQGKPMIVLGDLNVAHTDLDVWSMEDCADRPGFTDAERESFEETLEACGLVDAFRLKYPYKSDCFTAWGYRTRARGRNHGMRIDYALVSDDMVDAVCDVRILNNVEGSDHCPIAIELKPGFL